MSTPTEAGVHWQRKQAAMRDLILRMLCSEGDVISESSEGVPAQIRKYFGIPNEKTNNTCISDVLGLMEQAGLIVRDMNSARTRTTRIQPAHKAGAAQAIRLEFHRMANLATVLNMAPGADAPETVLKEVYTGFEAIQRAAREAEVRESNERVAINVTNILQDANLAGQRGRRVRYYLRELGVANAVRDGEYNHPTKKLWWWIVSPDTIDELRLMSLIVGDDNFEKWAEADERKKAARREKAEASAVPAASDEGDGSTARPVPKPGPPPGRKAAPVTKNVVVVVTDEDPTVTMAGIIEDLERQLEAERVAHRTALARKDETHTAQLAEKDAEIAQLQEQLRTRPPLDPRAAAAIARHTQAG